LQLLLRHPTRLLHLHWLHRLLPSSHASCCCCSTLCHHLLLLGIHGHGLRLLLLVRLLHCVSLLCLHLLLLLRLRSRRHLSGPNRLQ
jgi:hypothetical protein